MYKVSETEKMFRNSTKILKRFILLNGLFFYDTLFTDQTEGHEKGMTEIIYMDIDGTLRDEQKGIPASAVWALDQCRRVGIKVVICTGRNPGSVQEDVRALTTDGIISGGGCYITYHGVDYWKKHFSGRVLGEVLTLALERQLSLAMEADQKIFMDYNAAAFYREDFQHKISGSSREVQEIIREQNKIPYENNIGELQSRPCEIHKICMFGKKSAIDRTEMELAQKAEVIQKKEWNGQWYLELLPKGCHKGKAVRWMNDFLGILKENSMSFGDSENDIAMIKETGTGILVGNSSPEMIKYASSVCEPVTEDGIYKELVRRKVILPYGKERRKGNEKAVVAGGSRLSDLS